MGERPLCMREVPGSIPGFSRITHGIILLSFLLAVFFPHLFANEMQIFSHDLRIRAILLSTINTTKILVVHSLSPATEDGKNDDHWSV